jgi:hypothetical protein
MTPRQEPPGTYSSATPATPTGNIDPPNPSRFPPSHARLRLSSPTWENDDDECRSGGTGIRTGLKILTSSEGEGSTPSSCTNSRYTSPMPKSLADAGSTTTHKLTGLPKGIRHRGPVFQVSITIGRSTKDGHHCHVWGSSLGHLVEEGLVIRMTSGKFCLELPAHSLSAIARSVDAGRGLVSAVGPG